MANATTAHVDVRTVLAFDPGVHVGWASLLSKPCALRPQFVAGGVISADQDLCEEARRVIADFASGLVVIESDPPGTSKKAHRIRRGGREVDISGALQDMMRVAGIIEGIAVGLGREVLHVPATQWRRAVCGTATATDAQVKRMVTTLVEGLPAKSNAHLRDAVGCAYAAITRPRFVA